VAAITAPDLPDQAADWGLPDEPIEELRLSGTGASVYVKAMADVLPQRDQAPQYESRFYDESFDELDYPPEHVLPYLCDLFAALPRSSKLAYFGARPAMFDLVCRGWSALGFGNPILLTPDFAPGLGAGAQAGQAVRVCSEAEAIAAADFFLFEFGFASADDANARERSSGRRWRVGDTERLKAV